MLESHRADCPHPRFAVLVDLFSVRRLTGKQEGLDELPFAAHDKAGKPPELLVLRHNWLGIHPASQQDDLLPGNVPLAHPGEQMSEQRLRQFVAADLRHAIGRRRIRAQSPVATGRPPRDLPLQPFAWPVGPVPPG